MKLTIWLRYIDNPFIVWPHQKDEQLFCEFYKILIIVHKRKNQQLCFLGRTNILYREDNCKQDTVSLPYIRGMSEKIQRTCGLYNIRKVFKDSSTICTIFQTVMAGNASLVKHWKAIIHKEILKLVMVGQETLRDTVNHVWRKQGTPSPMEK